MSIRFAQSEQRDDHALLLSPWPESLFAFEPTWARLAEHTHLVAIDLPGFGHSQRRDALLSPRAMGEFVIRVADAFGLEQPACGRSRRRHRGLRCSPRPCIRAVFAASSSAAAARRFRSSWAGAQGLGRSPRSRGYRSADPRQIVAGVLTDIERYALLDSSARTTSPPTKATGSSSRCATCAAYPTELPVLGDLLPKIQTPVQIIAGARDPVVPPVNAEFLNERLPNSKLDIIDAGHFTWEDAADEYAALATSWWQGGYATTKSAPAR